MRYTWYGCALGSACSRGTGASWSWGPCTHTTSLLLFPAALKDSRYHTQFWPVASASLFSSSVLRKRSLPLRSFADWSQNLTFSRLRLLYSDGKTVALGTVFVNIFDNLNYVWAHIEIFIEYTKNKNVFLLNCFGGIFILIFRKVVTFNVYGL